MAIDSDLTFRDSSDGNLTGDEAGSTHILDLGQGGTGIGGAVVVVRVPQTSGTDTLVVTVQHDDSATLASVDHSETFPTITSGTTTLPGEFRLRVFSTRRYVGLDFNVTDTGGGVNFGAVEGYLTLGAASVGGARP